MNKYHKTFINSFASENIIALFSRYKNAHKEITESMAMLEAAKRFIPNVSECLVVVVGDGASPRTGAVFAYFTKAEVISVDPAFNMAHWEVHYRQQAAMGFPIQRLEVIKDKIEDVPIYCKDKRVLILWPHSHADMDSIKLFDYGQRYDIAMPCCRQIPSNWASLPHIYYEDKNILSPKRSIHIW